MSDSEPGISFAELFAYTDSLAARWINYFRQHPAALDIDVGGKTGTVRNLLKHIFEVEHFFSGHLLGEQYVHRDVTSPAPDDLMLEHQEAYGRLQRYLASTNKDELQRKHTVGPVTVSGRKLLAQAAVHSIHHWAQVAMEIRQAGFPTELPQDIIISNVME
ncbi:MAG TPA: DinB family protein [Candidatus Angelobacter sp.]|nr:DinB family protein [Candidatus Angelobacter sp.]